MSHLLDTLSRWRPFTALVVGDLILDKLLFGNADRLSPDAPVPVLHVQRSEHRPGGAANVCLDLVAMRGTVHALGVTGDDADGRLLRDSLGAAGIGTAGVCVDPSRPTTVKQSLIGLAQHRHPQKMFRVDHESRAPIPKTVLRSLLDAFERALPGADVVCIEDYNKGVCTPELCREVIAAARKAGVPVLVDPAAIEDYSKYRGAATITPNRNEAALAAGAEIEDGADADAFASVAAGFVQELNLDAAVITLDRHGALLLEKGGVPTPVPTEAREVYDVTGAGDMVLAALAAGRANGLAWIDAVRLANAAAGLEVQVFGVQPIPIEQIHREVMRQMHDGAGTSSPKVRSTEQAKVEIAAFRSSHGKSGQVVFANGCFDFLHAGHRSLLRRAKAAGGADSLLVVGLNSDASVKRLKGPNRPVNNEHERASMLAELTYVDIVVIFGEDTPEDLIRALEPDVLVKGAEYRIEQIPGAQFVQGRGGRVELLEMVPGLSTTKIIEKVLSK